MNLSRELSGKPLRSFGVAVEPGSITYVGLRLGALRDLAQAFPDAVLGLSDHSLGNYTCFGAVALGE